MILTDNAVYSRLYSTASGLSYWIFEGCQDYFLFFVAIYYDVALTNCVFITSYLLFRKIAWSLSGHLRDSTQSKIWSTCKLWCWTLGYCTEDQDMTQISLSNTAIILEILRKRRAAVGADCCVVVHAQLNWCRLHWRKMTHRVSRRTPPMHFLVVVLLVLLKGLLIQRMAWLTSWTKTRSTMLSKTTSTIDTMYLCNLKVRSRERLYGYISKGQSYYCSQNQNREDCARRNFNTQ